MDMIERVARSLCWHASVAAMERAGVMACNPEWIKESVDGGWEGYAAAATAAIEAMREPTEEMVLACVERGMPDVVTAEDSGPIVPALIWQAMIDTALKREDAK